MTNVNLPAPAIAVEPRSLATGLTQCHIRHTYVVKTLLLAALTIMLLSRVLDSRMCKVTAASHVDDAFSRRAADRALPNHTSSLVAYSDFIVMPLPSYLSIFAHQFLDSVTVGEQLHSRFNLN